MFTIRIKEMKAEVELGVYDWEKGVKRPVVLNIEMDVNSAAAGASDVLDDAVDYAVIEQRILETLSKNVYQLIEKLVTDVARLVLSLDTRIARVWVEAEKPGALASARCVAVAVELRQAG